MLEIARGLGKRHFLNHLFYCRVNGEIAPEVPALAPPALLLPSNTADMLKPSNVRPARYDSARILQHLLGMKLTVCN